MIFLLIYSIYKFKFKFVIRSFLWNFTAQKYGGFLRSWLQYGKIWLQFGKMVTNTGKMGFVLLAI
jgi:hypothetical protein